MNVGIQFSNLYFINYFQVLNIKFKKKESQTKGSGEENANKYIYIKNKWITLLEKDARAEEKSLHICTLEY